VRPRRLGALLRGPSIFSLDSMKRSAFLVPLLIGLVTSVSSGTDFTTETTVSATFECPEALNTDAERTTSRQQFMSWIRGLHPDWTEAKITGYRLYLLESHHCAKSLERLNADHSSVP
jgi:hypothetical protein